LQWEAIQSPPPAFGYPLELGNASPAHFVSAKIGAQGWSVHVFDPRLRTSETPSLQERLSLHARDAWAVARSPSGEVDLLDLLLDHGPEDMLVVAQRQVGQQIQIQRCIYHFHSDE
jgi:hypothetical protein